MTADLTLLELQMRVRRAVLGGDMAEIVAAIRGDGQDPAARLRIYRNHAFGTLGEALKGTFPVVCRLVDERFFAYAAHEYIRERPPRSRCLAEYGADFPDFLATFEPCRGLPYLPDTARFEWSLGTASAAREASAIGPEALATVPMEAAARVVLRLQPSLAYVASPWPIDAIWQAHQGGDVMPIDLGSDGARLEIRRSGDVAAWQLLAPGVFVFRKALADGLVLAASIAAAVATDTAFDPTTALPRLFAEGLVVGFFLAPEKEMSS